MADDVSLTGSDLGQEVSTSQSIEHTSSSRRTLRSSDTRLSPWSASIQELYSELKHMQLEGTEEESPKERLDKQEPASTIFL